MTIEKRFEIKEDEIHSKDTSCVAKIYSLTKNGTTFFSVSYDVVVPDQGPICIVSSPYSLLPDWLFHPEGAVGLLMEELDSMLYQRSYLINEIDDVEGLLMETDNYEVDRQLGKALDHLKEERLALEKDITRCRGRIKVIGTTGEGA